MFNDLIHRFQTPFHKSWHPVTFMCLSVNHIMRTLAGLCTTCVHEELIQSFGSGVLDLSHIRKFQDRGLEDWSLTPLSICFLEIFKVKSFSALSAGSEMALFRFLSAPLGVISL
ncbi:hypothetical protein CRENBAI_017793 [Crenichthys baileyi]|uniref:Uncharacterized protein n=1 Tax=Crenichthys baileyi TaxID=28760 RepID=A0AAV9SQN7_9TELE